MQAGQPCRRPRPVRPGRGVVVKVDAVHDLQPPPEVTFQCLIEVLPEILGGSRLPTERRTSPSPMPARRRSSGAARHASLRAGWHTRDSNAAQALGEHEHFQPRPRTPRRREAPFQLQADHAAEAVHLALGQGVLAMGGQARVMDALHLRVFGQEAAPGTGRCVRVPASARSALQAAQDQPAVPWPGLALAAFW